MEEDITAVPGAAAQPSEPGRPVPVEQPSTGDPRVDEAVGRLAGLAGLPAAEHPAVFEHVHQRLTEALGDVGPAAAGH